tara:strand:+ start:671 stop:1645 length:975 start_codon:yes stop_codon:yes gene_type:complete
MFIYLIAFSVSLITTCGLVPIIKRIGKKYSILDTPNSRKHQKDFIVRIGGIAIFLGFCISILFSLFLFDFAFDLLQDKFLLIFCLISSAFFFFIGLLDDIFELSALVRLILQILIVCFLWSKGLGINFIHFNNNFNYEVFPLISLIITILWFVGITNSINWIDGLDGLSSGIALIITSSMFILAFQTNLNSIALLSIATAGCSLGFLFYNFLPANIYMGDCGSNFLGSLLAYICIIPFLENYSNEQYVYQNFQIFYPIFILGIPFLDMPRVILTRIINKRSPFLPDRAHIHHILINLGFGYKKTVLYLYSLQILLIFSYFIFIK